MMSSVIHVKRHMRQVVDDLGSNEERMHRVGHETRIGHISRFEYSSDAISRLKEAPHSNLDCQRSEELGTFSTSCYITNQCRTCGSGRHYSL